MTIIYLINHSTRSEVTGFLDPSGCFRYHARFKKKPRPLWRKDAFNSEARMKLLRNGFDFIFLDPDCTGLTRFHWAGRIYRIDDPG